MPSIARDGTPPCPSEDWDAFPQRAMFLPGTISSAGSLMMALVDQKRFSEEELASFRNLIEKLDGEGE